jgi:hypothetical protein
MGEPRYQFGPLERRGLILGLTFWQLVMIGCGVAGVVTALATRDIVVVVVIGLIASAVIASAVVPIGGRTGDEWLPIVVSAGLRWAIGRTKGMRDGPLEGFVLRDGTVQPAQRFAPSTLSSIRWSSVPPNDPNGVGVIEDRRAGTYTAVMRVGGEGFALLDEGTKMRRLAWWGGVLETLCREGTRIHRLQWIERTAPEQENGVQIQRHDVHVALQVSARGSARDIQRSGGRRDGAAVVLLREMDALLALLNDPGVMGAHALTQVEIEDQVQDALALPGNLWPTVIRGHWDHLRTDTALHATYWIREWPRVEVDADFLAPLLLHGNLRQTVAVTMTGESPLRAQRRADAALVADLADAEMRDRAGFVQTFRRRRERDNVLRRGDEIASGHGSVRFSGYVTVSGENPDELESACADIEQRAQHARLHLQRMLGNQDVAFTYTLPLARGLR